MSSPRRYSTFGRRIEEFHNGYRQCVCPTSTTWNNAAARLNGKELIGPDETASL